MRKYPSALPKKRKIEFKHIWIEWLEVNVYWIQCSREQWVKKLHDYFGVSWNHDDSECGNFSTYRKNGTNVGVIWFTNKEQSLAHECFHAVCWILAQRDIEFNQATEEVYAYMLQYLIKNINGSG